MVPASPAYWLMGSTSHLGDVPLPLKEMGGAPLLKRVSGGPITKFRSKDDVGDLDILVTAERVPTT